VELELLTEARYFFLLGNDAIRQWGGIGFPSVVRCFGDVYQYERKGRKMMIIPVWHPGSLLRDGRRKSEVLMFLSRVKKMIEADQEGKLKWLI